MSARSKTAPHLSERLGGRMDRVPPQTPAEGDLAIASPRWTSLHLCGEAEVRQSPLHWQRCYPEHSGILSRFPGNLPLGTRTLPGRVGSLVDFLLTARGGRTHGVW